MPAAPPPDLDRIRGNVASMIDQGASEREVDSYLASEHITPQDLRGAHMAPHEEAAYTRLAQDPQSTAADLQAFARQRGFDVTDEDARAFIAARSRSGGKVAETVTYIGRGPDGARYNIEAPAGSTEADIQARVQDYAPANTTLESISATAQEALNGLVPGFGRTMAGVGGAIGNSIAAPLSDEIDWQPLQAFREEAAASDQDRARLETDHPDVASAAWGTGLLSSLALPQARVLRGTSLASGIGNAGINGATYGALSGALNDTGDGRLTNTLLGAGAGGVLGGVAPVAGRGVAAATSAARRNLPGLNGILTGLENVPRRLRGENLITPAASAHAQAERILARDMAGGTITTGMGTGEVPATPVNVASEVARRQSLGVPAIPADTSEPLRQTFTGALSGGGRMASRARRALASRQAQQASRIRGHLAETLGPAIDPIVEGEAILSRAKAAAGPAYRTAYAQGSPMVLTPELQSLMARPAVRYNFGQAYDNIRNRGGNPEAMGFRLDPSSGEVVLSQQPTFEAFDQVVRSLNGGVKRNPLTGRPEMDNQSASLSAAAQDLDQYLRRTNGAYADAKAAYADDMAIRDALERGRDVAALSGPEINAQRRTMPQHAQEAWTAGARTGLAERTTTVGLKPGANGAASLRASLGLSGAGALSAGGDASKQQAIEVMAARPGVLSRLDDRLEAEHQAYQTFAELAAPSGRGKTPVSDAAEQLGLLVDVAAKASTGRFVGALAAAARGNPRGSAAFRRDVQDRTAEILGAAEPGAVQEAMRALDRRPSLDASQSLRRDATMSAASRSAVLQAAGQDASPAPSSYFEAERAWAPPDPLAPLYGRWAPGRP
ncbi:hypothetical protein [Sphingomonas sp. GV3]|uniref:hypothetical protein n=1 Tax=Sphingomonas sp. GV3 TaxID=3040671 RepID=UPI00280AB53B|nr:hypothetical protein [Sphingomonas sp. GV3]